MKKSEIIQSLKVIALGLVLSLGIGYVFADLDPNGNTITPPAGWTAPGSNPPAGNTEGPINVGPLIQEKAGGLSVLGPILGSSNSTFLYKLSVGGQLPSPTVNSPTLYVNGNVGIKDFVITNPQNNNVKYDIGTSLCANSKNGEIVGCSLPKCGALDGTKVASKPWNGVGFCKVGNYTNVLGSGTLNDPWNWLCSNGAGVARCTALQTSVVNSCTGTYTVMVNVGCVGGGQCTSLPESQCASEGGCSWDSGSATQASCASFDQSSCLFHDNDGCTWN